MSVLTCLGCTARYAVGAPACPQCGSGHFVEGDAVADPTLLLDADADADGDTDADVGPAALPEPKAKAASKTTTT